MAQSLIACPLCSTASFSSTNALCLTLVNVATKKLKCTLCEEELQGIDKLTIHLLSHVILKSDFIKLINNEYSNGKINLNPEPLNLVKSQVEQTVEEVGHQPSFDIHLPISSNQPEINTESRSERPSLKIDDEVMIFFNKSNFEKEKHNKTCNTNNVENPHEKMFINHTNPNLNLSKNITNEIEIGGKTKSIIPNDNCFSIPSEHQRSYFNFTNKSDSSGSFNSQSSEEYLIKTQETNKQIWSHVNKNAFNNSNEKNSDEIKSSFLSPSGVRVLGYRCDICSLVFPDEHILSMHRQLIHVDINEDSSNNKSYKCHLCSKSFVMKGSLMVHMRVAHFGGAVVARLVEAKQLETNSVSPESAQFICSICSKGFKKEQQLIQHEKLHDGKQCDVCLKTFTTKYFLRKHKRLHTGEMPYSCQICNKSFTFQQSYHKHLLYHSDDKPYNCSDCGRSFKELSTLHNHQRIHTGEKPFSCENCGKCFRQRVSYLVHRRIHTGVMPYRCQDCGKTFRYKVSERTHKCQVSAAGNSSTIPDSKLIDTRKEGAVLGLSQEEKPVQMNLDSSEIITTFNNDNGPTQPLAVVYKNNGIEEQATSNYPEPTDFFSLVMSPSDRLQHLSLSADSEEPNSPQERIDSEALKQLLYDVADFNQLH